MKKIILLVILTLTLTACSNSQVSYDESSAPKTMDNFNEADIIGRMTDLKNGLTPKMKPSGSSSASEPSQGQAGAAAGETNQKQPASPAGRLEDLAAQFNSAIIRTNFGDITVKFYAQESPITVNNFLNLAKAGFYNGTKFHRVIKDFMIQGGDPLSKDDDWSNDGTGGPGYQFQDEINQHKLVKGSLAMANSGANTNGSQFFIVTAAATSWLDGKHTNFGYVSNGLDVVEKIEKVSVNENSHPTEDIIINSIELTK
ncbi:MAG: peptidylprolyl isomerase [Patescibacteria group bacterium]|nr:peptidylprolyl isomerase [Patescibacteria group bacterium]